MPIETPGYDEILLGGMAFNVKGGLLNVTELGKFERKITIGDHTKDSQDLLSTWIISDLSGGHGVAWHQTDATVNRYRYATLDVSLPGQWTSRLKANAETGAAATVAMLGDLLVGASVEMYAAFGTDIYIWNETTDAWDDTLDNLTAFQTNSLRQTPMQVFTGTGTRRMYIPVGTSGYDTYDGTTVTNVAAPLAKVFCVFGQSLICLDTSNQLHHSEDGTNWTSFGADGKVDAAETAFTIVPYRNAMGDPTIMVSTDSGVWAFDPGGPTLYQLDLRWPKNTSAFGRAACVWRGIYYVAVGLGVFAYNSSSGTITAMGLDRDDGLPTTYSSNNVITNLTPTYNDLYAKAGSGDGNVSLHRWTGFGWQLVWEGPGGASALGVVASYARDTYRLWWGYSQTAYTIELPIDYRNPKKLIVAGSEAKLESGGYLETGFSDMGMAGFTKIAHSAKIRVSIATGNPYAIGPRLYYRINEVAAYTEMYPTGGAHTPEVSNDGYQTLTFWFNSDRTGVAFDEIELKLTVAETHSVIKFLTVDFIKVPRANKAWQATLDLTASYDDESPDSMADKIDALLAANTITTMVHRGTTYYVRVASWGGTDMTGKGDDRGERTVQILETRYDAVAV